MSVPSELIYEGQYSIRITETNRLHQALPTALIDLMQEAALANVIQIKVSAWDLAPLSWVLMRKHLDIYRLPELGETITIQTHPAGFERLYTHRDYKVWDAKGDLIATSSSTWLLMNTERRRIARIPADVIERGQFDTSSCLPHALAKLPDVTTPIVQQQFRVNWHDMDFNGHLNNVRYMQWIFETVKGYTDLNQRLDTLDIIYKNECHWKDTVTVSTQPLDDQTYLHLLTRASDGKEIARAQTHWI